MRRPPGMDAGYGVVEAALVVMALAVLVAFVVDHYARSVEAARETALRAELDALRNTINLFVAVKGRCPESLKEMITAEFALPYKTGPFAEFEGSGAPEFVPRGKAIFKPEYLKSYALDGEENILDPFGLPYAYDPARCAVSARETRP